MTNQLPNGWTKARIGEYLYLKNGFAFKSSDYCEKGEKTSPVIRISDINGTTATAESAVHVIASEKAKDFIVSQGDLLVAMSGATTGKIGIYNSDELAYQNQRIGNLKLISDSNGSKNFRNHLIAFISVDILEIACGGAQPNISGKSIENILVELPPLAEQTEIATLLDNLLAQVDTLKTRLDAIPNILKRFRQSVLAAAVSGKLTEEWRESNVCQPPDLEDIYNYWLNEYQKNNLKYKTPNSITDDSKEIELPFSWINTQLGLVFDVYVGATPSRNELDFWEGNIHWVSSSEVAFCKITNTKEKITAKGLSAASTKVHPVGTVMLAMIGQGKTRGQAAILDIEACHNQNTAALRIPVNFVISEYLYFFLVHQYEETRRFGGGNNQQALNKTSVQSLPFFLPPIEEQEEIVRRVEELFAFADQIEQRVKVAQQRVNHLTQAILAKAFRGELTAEWREQNPELISGENSAAALLARIQAEQKLKQGLAKPARRQPKSLELDTTDFKFDRQEANQR